MATFAETLVAVAAGGGISTLGAVAIERSRQHFGRKRDDAERARHDEAEARLLRGAARVVQMDLMRAGSQIEGAIDEGRWWPAPHFILRTEGWTTHRDRLAGSLSDEDCWRVMRAFHEIEHTNEMQASRGIPFNRKMSEREAAILADTVKVVRAALKAITPLTTEADPPVGPFTLRSPRGSDP